MDIGFDISQTGSGRAGCGHYAHTLITSMVEVAPEHRYLLFPSFGDYYFDPHMPLVNPLPEENTSYGPRHFTRNTAAKFWCADDWEIRIGQPDIVHCNNYWCPISSTKSRIIYTLYDLGFMVDPTWTTEQNRLGCFEGVFRASIAADWLVTISESTKRDFMRMFPHFPENRIRVVYPPSRFSDLKKTGKQPASLEGVSSAGFWLTVGTVEPRKNLERLTEAYALYLRAGGKPMPLVIAGGNGWLMDGFERHLTNLKLNSHIIITGYVSDDELIWLYRNCYAHLYPSLFEGFGLPVLEGIQFGAPTLASNTTSIPEAAGDAAYLISPTNIKDWSDAMLRLVRSSSERDDLVLKSEIQARRFSSEEAANQVLKLYEEAVESPKRKWRV